MHKLRWLLGVMLIPLLAGCASDEAKRLDLFAKNETIIKGQISTLERKVMSEDLKNIRLIKQYAKVVKKTRPELSELVDEFASDAYANGPIINSLKERASSTFKQVKEVVNSEDASAKLHQEMVLISNGLKPESFNQVLGDSVNILAELSKGEAGELPAVSTGTTDEEMIGSSAGNLIGNPTYGNWRQNSSGSTYWEWYGKYAFFSNIFSRPVYYDGWSTHRRYSSYHDYGRDFYTTPTYRQKQQTVERQVKAKFSEQGKTFKSPYAKSPPATGNSSDYASKPSAVKQPSKFKSNTVGNNTNFQSTVTKPTKTTKTPYTAKAPSTSRSFSSGGK